MVHANRARRLALQGLCCLDVQGDKVRDLVDAFLAASRGGDFQSLLALLGPDVVLRADASAVLAGASHESPFPS